MAFRNCQDPFLQLVTVSREEKIFIEDENIKGEKGKGEKKRKMVGWETKKIKTGQRTI